MKVLQVLKNFFKFLISVFTRCTSVYACKWSKRCKSASILICTISPHTGSVCPGKCEKFEPRTEGDAHDI